MSLLNLQMLIQELCQLLAPKLTERVIPVEKKVLATLWLLDTPECFRSVGDRFDMSKSTLHKVFLETCTALADYRCEFIKMPETVTEMQVRLQTTDLLALYLYTCMLNLRLL